MRIESRLPLDRSLRTGTIELLADDGTLLLAPAPAYGKADNAWARARGNPHREPVLAGGDHPFGEYRVTHIEHDKQPARSYGPAFVALVPAAGEAYLALDQGRAGIGIHGGDLAANGSLRATHGCCRTTNDFAAALAELVAPELVAGRPVVYTCTEQKPPTAQEEVPA